MSEDLLSLVKNCSNESKIKLNIFFKEIMQNQKEVEVEEMQKELELIFNQITDNFPISKVREISKNERSQKELNTHQYNYGEIVLF